MYAKTHTYIYLNILCMYSYIYNIITSFNPFLPSAANMRHSAKILILI